jgi:isopenicillin-N epimerase
MSATESYSQHWLLDANITFLNHGAFGACPIPVLDKQQRLRHQLETEPLRFFEREFEPLLDAAREELAQFVGAQSQDLVFVPNATSGVNAVLRSLSFSADDELLTTSLDYNACRNALNFIASQTQAKIVVAQVPFPIESPQQVVEAVLKQVSAKTKLVLLDHVTSKTGLILPIQELVKQLTQQGIDTLIDGAHAPGMIPLNLQEIGATYYTGNCHKWLSAPKGAAFLYVRRDRQIDIRPLTISHGANSTRADKSRFQLEFDWMGTDDPTAILCVPAAISFMGSLLPGGWQELMVRNRQVALSARQMLCEVLKVSPPSPDEMIGSLAVILLPDAQRKPDPTKLIHPLQDQLLENFQIEVPVVYYPTHPKQLIRISAQVYNQASQYQYLASVLAKLL